MIDHRAFPDPNDPTPVRLADGTALPSTVFLKPLITQDNFHVGDFTYASDFDPPENWAAHLAPYLFPGAPGHLHIGSYCAIAHGVRFITAGANHAMDGLTTYPFPIFDAEARATYQPDTRDTIIGHDVWLGMNAMVLPGARIGHGAIIGAGSVVRGTIPDYAIVTGNPAQVTKLRFAPDVITCLLDLAWWDWPTDKIARARPHLMAGDITALEALA